VGEVDRVSLAALQALQFSSLDEIAAWERE
jgi:hypothetical protein